MNEEHTMSNLEGKQKQIATYEPNITAVLCVDHYNDFLSESGKLWPLVKEVAEEVNLLDNLRNIVRTRVQYFHFPCASSPLGAGRFRELEVSVSLSTSGIKEPDLCQRLLGRYVA